MFFCLSNASQGSTIEGDTTEVEVASYKVGMLGASGVGKTALTYQFTTSEYICAYDASLGKKFYYNSCFKVRNKTY